MLEEKFKKEEPSNFFNLIYGGKEKTLNGPIFFIIVGISCLFGYLALMIFTGSLDLQLFSFQETESIRPSLAFPFIGIIQASLLISAVVGLVLELLGVFWYRLSR